MFLGQQLTIEGVKRPASFGKLNYFGKLWIDCIIMFRHHCSPYARGGFVQSVRSVVLRDNDSETKSVNLYERHALYSCKFVNASCIERCVKIQKKQIEIRNLFVELPNEMECSVKARSAGANSFGSEATF